MAGMWTHLHQEYVSPFTSPLNQPVLFIHFLCFCPSGDLLQPKVHPWRCRQDRHLPRTAWWDYSHSAGCCPLIPLKCLSLCLSPGDCWLLAAIASLTLKKDAMAHVLPHDQEFDHRYAGIFHFQVSCHHTGCITQWCISKSYLLDWWEESLAKFLFLCCSSGNTISGWTSLSMIVCPQWEINLSCFTLPPTTSSGVPCWRKLMPSKCIYILLPEWRATLHSNSVPKWFQRNTWGHWSSDYFRLHGSYESLKGGSTLEAMEDFTGGVGELYETKKSPHNLFSIMKKALDRGSMMGCSIDVIPIKP